MENITVKYYCPLRVNFMDYNPCRSDEIDYYELDRRSAVCYVNEIKKAVADYDDGNMAEYFDEDESAAKKLVSAYWSVEVVDGILYGCIEATLKEPFTAEEELYFKDYIEGQNSDGFGEGFEQQEIKVDDGWITVNYWHSGNDYFIYNEREFMKHLSKKQPCAFAYKETEKCRNYWWNSKPGDRIPVAFLEFDCVSIELNLEKDSEGNSGAYLFVCKNYGNEEWESDDYATSDIQEELRMMGSWDEIEDFMYDELIKYCEKTGIDYTKAFIEEKEANKEVEEEKKVKRCPKCGNETFAVTAHVVQGWLVDRDGYYIATTEECVEVAHEPDNEDLWTCTKCHYEDVGAAFETTDGTEPKKEEAMPKVSMRVDFRILKKHGETFGIPVYASLRKGDLNGYLPIEGFTFTINGSEVPFDFNASSCGETLGIFHYESGEGEFFDEFGLSDVYDGELEKMSISRRDLTAEFLASASKINEFRLEFEMNNESNEVFWSRKNEGKDPEYKVELLYVSFKDMDTEEEFAVRSSVLATFNRRE